MELQIAGVVHLDGVIASFTRMRYVDMRRAFQRLRRPAHADQRDHRDNQQGPRSQWPALADTTRARYARAGKRLNRRILARLPNARRTSINAQRMILMSPVRWSMAHQNGPTIVGHGAKLPQRQFLWWSPTFMKRAVKEFRWAIIKAWLGIPW